MKKKQKKYEYRYPHPAVATDCVVLGFDGKEINVLLIERGVEPYKGKWAFPGGFLKMDETVEQCALRELMEETGLRLSYIKQIKVFSDVERDPRERVLSVAFYALVRRSEVHGGDDAALAKWFSIDEVQSMDLAFDHNMIFEEVMKCVRRDIRFEPIGFDLLDRSFTIPQLQLLYEKILDTKFDRRNFQKKVLQLGIVEPVDEPEPKTESMFACELESPVAEFVMCEECRSGRQSGKERFLSALFGNGNHAGKSAKLASRREDECSDEMAAGEANEEKTAAPQPSGRKPKRYRFNKENYDKMKDDENFKLEF